MSKFKRIKYVSRFGEELSAAGLTELEAQCVRNNRTRGLTGVLMAGGGLFFQLLEGEPEAVDAVLADISRDPRHSDLLLLSEETAEHRLFPDWAMKAVPIDAARIDRLEPLHAILETIHAQRRLDELLVGTLERTVWSEMRLALSQER